MNSPYNSLGMNAARRAFLSQCGLGLGSLAFHELLASEQAVDPLAEKPPHFAPKAKRVIYLFMAGGPSQLELFTDKPKLRELDGQPPPPSMLEGRRFAFLKGNEKLLGSRRKFAKYGSAGIELSELLPHHQKIVDEAVWLHGMTTDVFNHGPAKLFMNTGFQAPGRASFGSWTIYGLGSAAKNLPGFVVLQSGPRGPRAGSTLWSSGFLPTVYQGVPFRNQGDPILYLRNPPGVNGERQQEFFKTVGELNAEHFAGEQDPEIQTRMNAYEMAFRMQTSAPELIDLSQESEETLKLYGVEKGKPSFALNCLLARRLVERGVRFVQLYHTNWDHHGGPAENLEGALEGVCRDVDQASAALVLDLKRRGLLDDTLVIWGGEFGRTPLGEVRGTIGRDHHIDGFSLWMAGAGLKQGFQYGSTDEIAFGVNEGRVHVRDLHATLLHLLGIDHERLSYKYLGLDFRLTGVLPARVVKEIIA